MKTLKLRADASCDSKTKAENECNRSKTYRRSTEETMGDQEGCCQKSGVKSADEGRFRADY
jgi:hypothetical protein